MRNPNLRIALLFLPALFVAASGYSRHSPSRQASQGTPGVFDYYVLTLSWSPEFCHSPAHADRPECQSGHYGFVLHGLWPQYVEGYPENCSNAPGLANPAEMADLIPDAELVAHEWRTHGTCSGLDPESYFKHVREAFTSIKVPERFRGPRETFSISPEDVKSEFVRENPSFSAEGMTVSCGGNYLSAVSFCMSKDLKPASCRNLRDCRAHVMRVAPMR